MPVQEVMVAQNKVVSLFDFGNIRAIQNENMTLDINIEDAAEKLGLVKIQMKKGKEYKTVRYDRINKYSEEYGFSYKWEKGDFIPEDFFYWLAFKVENKQAREFRKNFSNALVKLRVERSIENIKRENIKEMLLLEENFKANEKILQNVVGRANSITIRGMAKLISSEGKTISERGLRELLKMYNILLKNGREPTQYALDRGLAECSYHGKNKNPVVLITNRGQISLLRRIFRPHVGENRK